MNNEDGDVVPVQRAADLLGYGRSSIYARLKDGSLDRARDQTGRSGVTMGSILAFLESPPSGRRPGSGRAADRPRAPGGLRHGLVDHRETVSRLLMVREAEGRAREAENRAATHLRKALKWRERASAHQIEAAKQMDELLVQFLTPDTPAQIETAQHRD